MYFGCLYVYDLPFVLIDLETFYILFCAFVVRTSGDQSSVGDASKSKDTKSEDVEKKLLYDGFSIGSLEFTLLCMRVVYASCHFRLLPC